MPQAARQTTMPDEVSSGWLLRPIPHAAHHFFTALGTNHIEVEQRCPFFLPTKHDGNSQRRPVANSPFTSRYLPRINNWRRIIQKRNQLLHSIRATQIAQSDQRL